MDHLPRPRSVPIEEDEQAAFIAEVYNGIPFLEWPSQSRFKTLYTHYRQGNEPQNVRAQPVIAEDFADLEIFLQTWLFFGLLHEFFGENASAEDFIDRRQTDRPFITTARLSEKIDVWMQDKLPDESELQRLAKSCDTCWEVVWRTTQLSIIQDKSILLAIVTTGETLHLMLQWRMSLANRRRLYPQWHRLRQYFGISAKITTNGLLTLSRSEYDYKPTLGFSAIYYVNKLQNVPHPSRSFSGTICKHRCAQGDCSMTAISSQQVNAILESGHIALLQLTKSSSEIEVSIVSSADHARYIAISHTWSDGLGNPVDNALPQCQLCELYDATDPLKSTEGELLIWLDTLCCPATSLHHKNLCLSRMTQIYSDAVYVLILDPLLSALSMLDYGPIEICARLAFSSWMTRLWTLQEGMLAKRLLVHLRYEIVDVDQLLSHLIWMYRQHLAIRPVVQPILFRVMDVRAIYHNKPVGVPDLNILGLTDIVEGRVVTEVTDESLCLASCLGLPTEPLLASSDQDRMATFWRTLASTNRSIPRSIIFFYGEHLKHNGLSWAPASLLNGHYNQVIGRRSDSADELATLTPEGLSFHSPGLRLKVAHALPEEDRKWFSLDQHIPFVRVPCRLHGDWLELFHDPDLPQHLRPSLYHMVADQDADVVISDHDLDKLTFESHLLCVLGKVQTRQHNTYRCEISTYTNLEVMRSREAMIWEFAWNLMTNLPISPVFEDLREQYAANPEKLSELKTEASLRLYFACEKTSQNQALMDQTYCRNEEELLKELYQTCLLVANGWMLEISEEIPETQQWCAV